MRRYRTGMYPFLFPSVISSLPLPSPTERLNPPSSAGTPSPVGESSSLLTSSVVFKPILTVSPSSNSLSLTQLELLPSSNSGAPPKACLQHENTWHIPNSLPRAGEARVASLFCPVIDVNRNSTLQAFYLLSATELNSELKARWELRLRHGL
ncbi:hypothetical protein MHYP_G00303490 [Metynnis hypsauchen]